jgi:hypothetical protein
MVEVTNFPHLGNKHRMYGVPPRSVSNEVPHIEGTVPEPLLVGELLTVMDSRRMAKFESQWVEHAAAP